MGSSLDEMKMREEEKHYHWLEAGRQIGKTFSFELNGETCWSSVGVQKLGGIYKVYIDEILESGMNAEKYLKEDLVELQTIDAVKKYIRENSRTNLGELTPLKGARIFNPEL